MSNKLHILRSVDVEEVERYHLISELHKLSAKLGWDIGNDPLNQLRRAEVWTVGQHLSWYNQDYTGEFLGRADFDWFEAICPVNAITFVDANYSHDTTAESVQFNLTPVEFAAEIARWREEHIPEIQPLLFQHVILRQRGDQLLLLDGNHRFKRLVAEGNSEIKCYLGRPNPDKPKQLTVTGPEIRRLRDLWRTAPEGVRESIFQTTKHLISASRNGAMAVEIFWIMYGREPETRATGRRLLGRDPNGPDRRYNSETGRFE